MSGDGVTVSTSAGGPDVPRREPGAAGIVAS